jgi:uncharacterized cupin superfamily protein
MNTRTRRARRFGRTLKPFAQLREAVVSSADGRSGVASYDATGFRAGAWSLPAHGKAYVEIEPNAIEVFVLVKGELFVVDADGAVARRCVAGDVVFLPQSWRGTLRGGDAAAEAAAVSVANGTSVSVVSAGIPNVAVSSLGNSAERDEMYDPENESRGRR